MHDAYWEKWLSKWFAWLCMAGIVANATGLWVTILEPDGALYATIAKTMVHSGDYIRLMVEGKDWLDKPHFPFWMTAWSFKLFGVNTLAYKLPAFLFWAAGGVYTYLLAKALYGTNIARLSVLIYLTAAHLVISNNDVRAEPYLTGLIVGSVYHFYWASKKNLSLHLVAGALLAACSVMTKGPFVLIIIGSGFVVDWILKKEWKQFFHYKWWLAVLLTFIFILPEIYCLYQQFDLHPEKIIFGRKGVSGLHFFFWGSQFGRFFNTGPIKGKGDVFFYVHTLLWAFLPWSILFFVALISRIRNLYVKPLATNEGITIGISLVTFVLFSLSRFQLPHYMNIVFPFFAILTARYVYGVQHKKALRVWTWIQNIQFFLVAALLILLAALYHLPGVVLTVLIIAAACGGILFVFSKNGMAAVAGRTYLVAIVLYLFLNTAFYPDLLRYQSGSAAADFINTTAPGETVCTYQDHSYAFAFYLHQPLQYYLPPQAVKEQTAQKDVLVFSNQEHLDTLQKAGFTLQVLATFPQFHTTRLTGKFLNYRTRESVTQKMMVAKVLRTGSGN